MILFMGEIETKIDFFFYRYQVDGAVIIGILEFWKD